ILEEGRLTDSQGREVDFKNTIIIMTSNIGSQILLENVKDTGVITESTEKAVMNSLNQYFKPEIINRMDDIVLFKPLSVNDMSLIVDKILTRSEEHTSELQSRFDLVCLNLHSFPTRRSSDLDE